MRLKTGRVALGGVQLDELDPAIVIRSIDPGTPQESVSTVNTAGIAGSRVTGARRTALDVSVTYAIGIPKKDLKERRRVFDLVQEWAHKKGWLTVSWMTGRRVWVDRVVYPSSGSLWEWTSEFTLTFRSLNTPFWRDSKATSVAGKTKASDTLALAVPGTERTVIGAEFENRSGKTINGFTLAVKSGSTVQSKITLAGMGLQAGETLVIDHPNSTGVLRIRRKNGSTYTSVYDKYTGSDDTWADPGAVTVEYTADRAGVLTVTVNGRYV